MLIKKNIYIILDIRYFLVTTRTIYEESVFNF